MKHVWNAIELCHLKLLSECDRLESARAIAARVEAASRSGAPATIERAADALTEAQAELRAILAARQAFKDLYGDPTDEENTQHA